MARMFTNTVSDLLILNNPSFEAETVAPELVLKKTMERTTVVSHLNINTTISKNYLTSVYDKRDDHTGPGFCYHSCLCHNISFS